MNFSMIVYILAWVLRIEGISLLLPFICAILYKEYNTAAAILAVSAVFFSCGSTFNTEKTEENCLLCQRGFCYCGRLLVGFVLSGSLTLLYQRKNPPLH